MKQRQNIVLMVEPSEDKFTCATKIGNLFINRFAIDEEAAFEIIQILEFEKSFYKMEERSHVEFNDYSRERKEKGSAQALDIQYFAVLLRIDIEWKVEHQ